ncbi:MAG: hypothetical protein JWM74_5186 [Myxococcaceae bacterium]|jgi:hypothetical protein|nr:hypothetical protein [Myxococcaceae bacterium]
MIPRTLRAPRLAVVFFACALTSAVGFLAACTDDDNPIPATLKDASTSDVATDAGAVDAAIDSACQPTGPKCNSCVADDQDPYNACSSAITDCVPFDNARIPQGPNGGIPQVP